MNGPILFVVLGIITGIFSGILGLGGGVIIIPLLVFFCGFTQHMAQGTTLAMMVPPIGLVAAWMYYKKGFVNLPAALFICLGFIAGSVLGAQIATHVPGIALRRTFGVVMLLMSLKLIFAK